MPEGRDHPKEARSPEPPTLAAVAGQAEGLIQTMIEKRTVEETLLKDADRLCQVMRGALGDLICFHFLLLGCASAPSLGSFFHLSMLLKISCHVLILWSVALVQEVHNQL
jgi:hypothetical protein